ncbi:hypothetical protein FOXB_13860 [Fusarium oxysporum f. sp. conglutinans Fo5176]|uniref:Uncharacterized protein n=1 Tax=Fusarium oxysporum (strain Fo5176) TaxID=660025 RepID=F9G5C8_FUSOF|nr:hypothetical protein FOXB_13860 [Fusarium oxysporum f. sp. conglutinans Fo5176]
MRGMRGILKAIPKSDQHLQSKADWTVFCGEVVVGIKLTSGAISAISCFRGVYHTFTFFVKGKDSAKKVVLVLDLLTVFANLGLSVAVGVEESRDSQSFGIKRAALARWLFHLAEKDLPDRNRIQHRGAQWERAKRNLSLSPNSANGVDALKATSSTSR